MFLITETNAEEMLWQATADFSFRMPEGYVGPIPSQFGNQRMARGCFFSSCFMVAFEMREA